MSSDSFLFQEELVEFLPGETVLDALLRNEKPVDYGCKTGSCQSCLLQSLTSGVPARAQEGLAEFLKAEHCFLACKCPATAIQGVKAVGDGIVPTYSATIVSRDMLTEDVLRLRLRPNEPLSYHAGEFVRFMTPDGLKRSYSIANSALEPTENLEFHIRLIPGGKMSAYLSSPELPELTLHGPFGTCVYSSEKPNQPIVFIGSGTGLAPIYAVLTEALDNGHLGKLSLFFGGATRRSLYFIDELQELVRQFPNLEVCFCSDAEDEEGFTITGSPLDIALAQIGSFSGYRVYTCGHPGLVKATKKKTFLAGANMADIFSDSFDDQV